MKMYIKKMPTLKAHKIDFDSQKGILDVVNLMEQGRYSLTWHIGNRYPSICFHNTNDKTEYSHGDYLVWDNDVRQYFGYTRKAFEECWEEIDE